MLQPKADRLLVKPDEALEHATESGIVIAPRDGKIVDSDKQHGRRGTVVSVGPGLRDKYGFLHPLTCKPGDQVYFGEFMFPEYHDDDGQKYFVIQEADVTAHIPKGELDAATSIRQQVSIQKQHPRRGQGWQAGQASRRHSL